MVVKPSMESADFGSMQSFLQFHHVCIRIFLGPRTLGYQCVLTVEFEEDMKDRKRRIRDQVLQSNEGCRQIEFLESKQLLQHHRLW